MKDRMIEVLFWMSFLTCAVAWEAQCILHVLGFGKLPTLLP